MNNLHLQAEALNPLKHSCKRTSYYTKH